MDLVVQRRHEIKQRTKLDAEFFIYITTASCIAAVGLITDSSEIVVASMVICPIMNHVNALTFGALLRDTPLCRQGTKGILVSTIITTGVGVCAGLYFSTTMVLTRHMLNHTFLLYLTWSYLVAFFSAIAAGISILADRQANLIGVAISTSILPPLVNFGLLLPNTLMRTTNSVDIQACLRSLLLAIGNITIIAITCFATIHLYIKVPSTFPWRTQIEAARASSSSTFATGLETVL
jgi:uncharacterized hydrophobic protein (TIGR00271 family)